MRKLATPTLFAAVAVFAMASASQVFCQTTPPVPLNSIFVAPAAAKAGETVGITIWVGKQNIPFNGIQFALQFRPVSPAGLTSVPTGVEGAFMLGTLFPASSITAVNADEPGVVRVAIATAEALNGPGLAATVAVKTPSDLTEKATYAAELRELILSDENGEDVTQATVLDGVLEVEPAGPAVTKGDINGDGSVTIPDVTIALLFAVGKGTPTAAQLAAGDINNSGKIDISDVIKILRAAVGIEKLS